MGLPDKHDPRLFQHYAKFDRDGNVVAVVEIVDGAMNEVVNGFAVSRSPLTLDTPDFVHVNVTDIYPYDVVGVKVTKAKIQTKDQTIIKAALIAALAVKHG